MDDKLGSATRIPNSGRGVIQETMSDVQDSFQSRETSHGSNILWTAVILLTGVVLVVAFFHFDKHDQVSKSIQSLGSFGIIVAILLMALFCVVPVPSEFLMVMNMKVFGVWWGIFYTWIGAMLGAVTMFFLARCFGRSILRSFISPSRIAQVENWVRDRGPVGLLMARLIPLPFIVVNYAAGILHSVKVADYVWTTGIALIPYDVGAALVYLGISKKFMLWLVTGGVAIVAIWTLGYISNRVVNRTSGE